MSKLMEAVRINGREMWRMTETGPRGGKVRHYCVRHPGQAAPSHWQIWSPTARQASEGDMVGCASQVGPCT